MKLNVFIQDVINKGIFHSKCCHIHFEHAWEILINVYWHAQKEKFKIPKFSLENIKLINNEFYNFLFIFIKVKCSVSQMKVFLKYVANKHVIEKITRCLMIYILINFNDIKIMKMDDLIRILLLVNKRV